MSNINTSIAAVGTTDPSTKPPSSDLSVALWNIIVSRSDTELNSSQQQASNGNSYLLVATDYFTHWVESYPIPNQEAVTVANKLTKEFFFVFLARTITLGSGQTV